MNKRELVELQKAAFAGISSGNSDLEHLSNKVGIANYIRIANEIKNNLKSGKILDWGCGYGHMTYLMENRGFSATAYEVLKRDNIEKLPVFSGIDIIYGKENFRLPFSDEMFDAVLSCGTLEHVENIDASLGEVRRILKKNGKFFIYMLPNKFSYTEWIAKKRGISVHPVKFNKKSIYRLFEKSGFKVVKIKRSSVLPKNLTGLPGFIKKIYGNLYFLLIPLDNLLSKIPLLNNISGVFEIIAVKI